MIVKILSSFLVAVLITGAAITDDTEMSKSEKRLAKLEEDYVPTGKTRRCVSLNRLRDSIIIDDQTIFFRAPGKTAYVNRLPRKCSRLAVEERYSYSTSIGQLCRFDLITVLDSFGQSWNRCGLGDFEEWEKKPKDGGTSDADTGNDDEQPE
ncbi:hypothetical protein [Kordiimonas pumila]|uniref:Uncharacterized protein n=1 Tax=Kordiimonas pumila TaxID=2161677 RepID=A0ABV7D6U5_9PROT|nr:hypothetical protein [Kordiimonas pumila]